MKSARRPADPADHWPEGLRVASSGASEGSLSDILGAPHYSYRFAEACFHRMFAHFAVPVARLRMPEYYANRAAFAQAGWADGPIAHLMFRSTEDIRLLKPATNIACFAWEFDVLSDHTFPESHPFMNQTRMLGLCDEVWVPSEFTRNALERYGIREAYTIPAPIEFSGDTVRDRLQALAHLADITVSPLCINFLLPPQVGAGMSAAREMGLSQWLGERLKRQPETKIYLAVLNPEDFRKNLDAMIRGFYHFAQEFPDRVLIIKTLTSKNRFSLAEVVSNVVKNKLAAGTVIESDSIVFFNDYLPETGLSWLYQLADFYLCTSLAEGQNLPLLEAMWHGTVPVSTCHTAMADYITDQNAVLIPTRRIANDNRHLAGSATGKPFDIDWCGTADVYRALRASAAIAQAGWQALSDRAAATVAEKFSFQTVWSLVSARLGRLVPDAVALAAE